MVKYVGPSPVQPEDLTTKGALDAGLGLKANLASPTFSGTVGGITKAMVGLGSVDNTADSAKPVSSAQTTAINAAKARSSHTGTQLASTISDFSAAADARVVAGITGKANLAAPTFTGTVSGVSKAMVGLGSVDNTADAAKPVSTAQQTAINGKADASHKYHTFIAGDYFYDTYNQDNYLRLFTQNAAYSTTRFRPLSNTEYWDGAAWVTWVGGDSFLSPLLDGRENTGPAIDHTHRKFRFIINASTGYPTTALLSMQSTWTGISYPGMTVTTENSTSLGGVYTVRDTAEFRWDTTGGNWGTHLKVVGSLHNGASFLRITVDITDWADSGAYVTVPLRGFEILSNYSGTDLLPFSWDYAKTLFVKGVDATSVLVDGSPVVTVASATKDIVGLGSVDNTADSAKPVSTAQAAALAGKANTAHTHLWANITDKPEVMPALGQNSRSYATPATDFPMGQSILLVDPIAGGPSGGGEYATLTTSRSYGAGGGTIQWWNSYQSSNTNVYFRTWYYQAVGWSAWQQISVTGHTHTAANVTDFTAAADARVVAGITGKANLASPTFTGTVSGVTATHVGLGSVNNTADSAKPVSSAQQTALNLKANLASPTFTGTVSGVTATHVGLGSVNNTADTAKPVSTAQQTALNLKANLASPTFTGTVSGVTKAHVGLSNVDNTTDALKPVSTAQAAADTVAKARANHTGTQLASTISDLPATIDAAVDARKPTITTDLGLDPHDIKIDPTAFTGPVGTQLIIPTHLSPAGGQLVHPSVVYYQEGWNGYKYWMGMTPYPSGNDSAEDPNVVCSHDGITWVVPAGLTNPLDDGPGSPGSYNSDTCMAKGPDNVLHLFWRSYDSTLGTNQEKIWMATSTNGYQWTAKILVHQSTNTVRRLVSPAFIYDKDRWVMFAIDVAPSPNTMVRMRAVNAIPNNWDAPTILPIGTMLSGKEAWHLSVRKVGSQHVALLNDCLIDQSGASGELLMMVSDDGGWTFTNSGKTIIPKVAAGKHDQLYASTFIPTFRKGILGFEVWYSAWLTAGPVWNVYKTWVGPTAAAGTQRIEAGKITMGTLGAGGFYSVAVVFPGGAFSSPPSVVVSTDSGRTNAAAISVTATGFTFGVNNWTSAGTSALNCNWIASATT